MVHSILSLSINGDDHVINNKNKYNSHALMITLWGLYILKHMVERITHVFTSVTLLEG
jgi:hypothetical protein